MTAAIPILSRFPIIGNLFKSKADRAERTELMVLITPRLVRPLDPDEVPPLPTNAKPFLPGRDRGTAASRPPVAPWTRRLRSPRSEPGRNVRDGARGKRRSIALEIRASAERREERGAALIHMAIAMVAMMAFSALVIDYGIFWVARRQAQNSADAGALAGAIAYAFDDSTDLSDTGPAKLNAVATAQRNVVYTSGTERGRCDRRHDRAEPSGV